MKKKKRYVGTHLYSSPEAIQEEEISTATDVFSFAILFCEMISEEEPFKNKVCKKGEIIKLLINDERPDITNEIRGEPIPQKLNDLIKECWKKIPKQRPNFISINETLQTILKEIALPDPLGQQFWHKRWPNCTHVPYNLFIKKLLKYLELDDILERNMVDGKINKSENNISDHMKYIIEYFKSLISSGNDADIEKFGKTLIWFGPLRDKDNINVFNRIENLLKCDWFFGVMNGSQAKAIMKKDIQKKKKGNFYCTL